MAEKIPPDPVSVPPKNDDEKSRARSEFDPITYGTDGKSPIEAMADFGPELKDDARRIVDRVRNAIKEGRTAQNNYRPHVLDGEEPPPIPSTSEEAARTGGLGDMESGAPIKRRGNYQAIALEGEADFAVAAEDADADVLKKALAEQMLKPAEIKKHYQNLLRNSVERLEKRTAVGTSDDGRMRYRVTMDAQSRISAIRENKALMEAQEEYIAAQKKFYQGNNVLGRVAKRFGSSIGLKSKELQEMERTRVLRDEKRLEAKAAFEKAAKERWTAEGRDRYWIAEALRKYENLHLFKEIIAPAAKLDIQARAEALGEKGPDALEKGMGWMKRQDEKITNLFASGLEAAGVSKERATKIAPYARGIGIAVLVGGAGFVGSFGTLGLVAAAGFGGYTVLRKVGAFALGVGAAEAAGSLYHLYGERIVQAGARKEDKDIENKLRNLSKNKELTIEIIQALDKQRHKLQDRASDETLENKTRAVKVLVGLGVGIGTALSLAEHQGTGDAIRAGVNAEQADPGGAGLPADSGPSGGEGTSQVPEAQSAIESVPQEARSLAISGNINNADRLVGHFGLQLEEAFEGKEPPASVQSFLDLLRTDEGSSLLAGEDKATLHFGLQTPEGASVVMHAGDTIGLNAEGQIVLERPGTDLSTVLVDADGKLATSHAFPMEGAAAVEAPAEAAPAEAPKQTVEALPAEVSEPPATEAPVQPEAISPLTEPAVQVPQQPATVDAPVASEPAPTPVQFAPAVEPLAPADTAPTPEPAAPEQPPVAAESLTNRYGIDVNPQVAELYADENGTLIVYGGELPERMEIAQAYLRAHPEAVLYFDSSMPDPITSQMIAHITQAFVDPNTGIPQMPNEAMNPQLQGYTLPTADDLARRVDR